MNKTPNYQLNQWERADRVLMEDFNADNAKIDAAIKAVDKRVDGSATQAALNALSQTVAGKARVAAGTYTGDDTQSRVINVGFTPKAVLLFTVYGRTGESYNGNDTIGGLAVTGSPLLFSWNGQTQPAMEIVNGGFRVIYKEVGSSYRIFTNSSTTKYNYIAIG